MADQNNLPESEDTKTRVTAKISADTPGKSAPPIDLETPKSDADSSTMTRRTLKLQGLAGMAGAPKATPAAAPAAAPAPSADDTRTRRTVKLASLAGGPAVKPLNVSKPAPAAAPKAAPAVAPAAPAPAEDTVTRRIQKLDALDTQDVIALSEADLNADTTTRKTVKISAAAPPPPPPAIPGAVPKTRQTVKVEGIAPAHTPVIDLNAKVGDTNTRKTVKLTAPEAAAPEIDLEAKAGDDTNTRKSVKVEPVKASAANVDDTVKLQRPAPKPAMPGSVAPAAQSGAPAVGGIKLNKPAAPKPAAPAAPTAAPTPTPAPAADKPAEPTGNLGKNQEPPKEKKGLKVNTDAIKDLGSAPMVQGDTPAPVAGGEGTKKPRKSSKDDSFGFNITFAIFASLAALFMIFIALVAVTDYINIWQSGEIELPIISDYVYNNLK